MDWNYTDIASGGDSNATTLVGLISNVTSLLTLTSQDASLQGQDSGSLANSTTVIQPVFSLDWNVEVNNVRSYSFLIVLLSIAVLMAVLFVLFGLFMKAGAHTLDATLSTANNNSLHNALGTHTNSQNSYSNLLKDEFSLFVDDDTHFMEC